MSVLYVVGLFSLLFLLLSYSDILDSYKIVFSLFVMMIYTLWNSLVYVVFFSEVFFKFYF